MKYKDLGQFERAILLNISGFMLEHKADYINISHIKQAMKPSPKGKVTNAVIRLAEKRLEKALYKLVTKYYLAHRIKKKENYYGLIPGRLI